MLNNISLIGRITRDLELQITKTGKEFLVFSIAVDRNFGEGVDYFECEAWYWRAEFIKKIFKKGDIIEIYGEIRTKTFKNRNGERRKSAFVLVRQAFLREAKKSEGKNLEGNYVK